MIRFALRRPIATTVFALLALAGGEASLQAQENPGPDSEGPRPLTLEDYGAWSRVRSATLSPDGRWFSFGYEPNDGDAPFHIRDLDGEALHDGYLNASRVTWSSDSRWIAFLTAPPEEEAEKLRKARERVPSTLHVLAPRQGEELWSVEGVASFAFSEDGAYLAVLRDRTASDSGHQGADLLLRRLDGGVVQNFGNVSEFAFDDGSTTLAFLVDAAEGTGNGVFALELGTGRLHGLHGSGDRYAGLTWQEDGDRLAALVGDTPEGMELRANRVLHGTAEAGLLEWDPGASGDVPAGFVVSEMGGLSWSDDGRMLFLGIKEQETEAERNGDSQERANVDVWHWMDERPQGVQMVQASRDRNFTFLSVLRVEEGRFFRLANDNMRSVDRVPGDRWALGRWDRPYRMQMDLPQGYADIMRIDLETGELAPIAKRLYRPMGTSPDGRWFMYVNDDALSVMSIETTETVNLSDVTGADLIDREFDRPVELPAYGVGGWSEDGSSVLLYDRFDVWRVRIDEGTAENLTGGMGAREQIRFRVVDLDREEEAMDVEGPLLLSAYGEWTKRSGYFRTRGGSEPEPLLFGDEMVGTGGFGAPGLLKAEEADRVAFTRQTFRRFPDFWVSDLSFRDPRRITEANPQIGEFLWGDRVLVDYTDERGNRLQATLTLPAGYEEGRRYPMVVYFYEKMSQRHHEFSAPVYDDRPHMSVYASQGYLVLMPDIVYDVGRPGFSALDDVTAATQAVIEAGYADPDRIGLQGHSWGGYQSSFILTQTDMFAAVVTGAPLTNLVSMAGINYKRTGNPNGPILEWSQGRMATTIWDDLELYQAQSPVHHADKITTPFVILHGTEDGAVDWVQGLEFFNAARRLGKEGILLSYPGEPHHLAREENQKDFQVRMKQFFDHHLRDAPAPDWMIRGVPHLEKDRASPRDGMPEPGPVADDGRGGEA